MRNCYPILLLLFVLSCKPGQGNVSETTTSTPIPLPADTTPLIVTTQVAAANGSASGAEIVAFAKTLLGTPYQYACSSPSTGFDCSGFITYVFTHFNIEVPRSSVDFTNAGMPVPLDSALAGDLILFTGTDVNIRTVGHIGIVVTNDTSGLSYIHSSSGKENAVIITSLNERNMARFVKVIRILI